MQKIETSPDGTKVETKTVYVMQDNMFLLHQSIKVPSGIEIAKSTITLAPEDIKAIARFAASCEMKPPRPTCECKRNLSLEQVITQLYRSEINACISWIWDSGYTLEMGNAFLFNREATRPESIDAACCTDTAANRLAQMACTLYPNSAFAEWYQAL